MRIYREEIFGPVLGVARAPDYQTAVAMTNNHEFANGVAIFTRDGDTARTFASEIQVGMVGVNVPIPVPGPSTASAAGKFAVRRSSHAWAGGGALLCPAENHHHPLVHRYPRRHRLRHADDEVIKVALSTRAR